MVSQIVTRFFMAAKFIILVFAAGAPFTYEQSGRTRVISSTISTGHMNLVTSLSFSNSDSLLVSGSLDGTARTWDINKKRRKRIYQNCRGGISTVSVSPNGKLVA